LLLAAALSVVLEASPADVEEEKENSEAQKEKTQSSVSGRETCWTVMQAWRPSIGHSSEKNSALGWLIG
jgi:hypothetical protein